MNIDINQEPIEILFNINNILKQNQLGKEEKQQLSDICDILLERIITRQGKYQVIPVVNDSNYDSGYFVSSLDYLTKPYQIHEHKYIDNGNLKLTEVYYTGANGLKYRKVAFPEVYKDPGFLLNNSLLAERQKNMAYLANKRNKENKNI